MGLPRILHEDPRSSDELGDADLARIPRYDVHVQMVYARAGRRAHVVPDVVARGFHDVVERAEAGVDEHVELGSLLPRELADVQRVPPREDYEVPGVVG